MYTDEQVARVCHAVNCALQRIHGDPMPSVPWDCESDGVRAATLEGVRRARRGVTPREHHEEWAACKRKQGWTWGPEKDPEGKKHPNLVESYADLPPEERIKDQMFLLTVTGMTIELLPDAFIRGYQEHGHYTAERD